MKLNKLGQHMPLRTFLIGFIMVLLVFTIIGNFINNVMVNYEITPDGNFTAIYTGFDATLDNSSYEFGKGLQESLEGEKGEKLDIIGGEAGVLKTMYNVIKTPFNIISDMVNVLELVGKTIGIPGWVIKPLIGVLMVLLSVIILGIIFRSTGT